MMTKWSAGQIQSEIVVGCVVAFDGESWLRCAREEETVMLWWSGSRERAEMVAGVGIGREDDDSDGRIWWLRGGVKVGIMEGR